MHLINKRFRQLNDTHQTMLYKILHQYINTHNPEIAAIARFIIERHDINPYSYLGDKGYLTEDSSSLVSLLANINHALYDDGDISFITVNEEPRIVFVYHRATDFEFKCLSESEQYSARTFVDTEYAPVFEVKLLKDVFEFINKATEYHRDILEDYIQAVAQHGFEYAEDKFRNYHNFRYEWEDDEKIQEMVAKAKGEIDAKLD